MPVSVFMFVSMFVLICMVEIFARRSLQEGGGEPVLEVDFLVVGHGCYGQCDGWMESLSEGVSMG